MKNNQESNIANENNLPKRIDKALAWLTDSRNKWKEKCIETKLLLKRQTFAVKRLKDCRNDWKLTCSRLKQKSIESKEKISSLQSSVDKLESQIEIYRNEIQILKKSDNLQFRFEV